MTKTLTAKNLSSLTWHSLFLVLIKETYLFVKNLYGLLTHPFKTIVSLRQNHDKSQTLLVFGLPIYLFIGGTILFLPFFWLIRNWYNARILSLIAFYVFSFVLFVLACYLFYWLVQYYLKCKSKPKS
jgi:hypothetical protein